MSYRYSPVCRELWTAGVPTKRTQIQDLLLLSLDLVARNIIRQDNHLLDDETVRHSIVANYSDHDPINWRVFRGRKNSKLIDPILFMGEETILIDLAMAQMHRHARAASEIFQTARFVAEGSIFGTSHHEQMALETIDEATITTLGGGSISISTSAA